jgi:hypothetical protein
MNVPSPRVREVLSVLGDLSPDQARVLLGQVVATLDAAELLALRSMLPPAAVRCLPSCVGAETVINEAPMPWEFVEPPRSLGVETGKIIAEALPPSRKRAVSIAALAGALVLVLGTSLLWPAAEAPSLVPLPPASEYAPMAAPQIAGVRKVITKASPKKPSSSARRSEPAEWASPFGRRH